MTDHHPSHAHRLAEDLQRIDTLMARRRALKWVAGAGTVAFLAGCGGSAAADEGRPVPAEGGRSDPVFGRELAAFVDAAGRGDEAAMWRQLSPQTRATLGPTYPEFRRGLAADLEDE